jgi:hypothetical protein
MNSEYVPLFGERLVHGPDGVDYVVRVSGAGVERSNYRNWIPFFLTTLRWRLMPRKAWQVEVYRLGRIGPEYPPVFHERMEQEWIAETKASILVKDLAEGRVGWDRWHAPTRPSDTGDQQDH